MSYKVVSYTNQEVDYFYGLNKKHEEREGRRLTIYELIDKAIDERDNDYIFFLHYMQSMIRSKRIEDKTKHTNFNFRKGKDITPHYTQKDIYGFNKSIEEYINDYFNGYSASYDELIDKAIENEDWNFVNYLAYEASKEEGNVIESKIAKKLIEEEEEKEKRVKKKAKKVIKDLKGFKEVKERENADALLIINKNNMKNYDIRLNDFPDKQVEMFKEAGFSFYYLKNTNSHDRRNSTCGIINKKICESKRYN